MIELSKPDYSFSDTLYKCIEGITGNDHLKVKLSDSLIELTQLEIAYLRAAQKGELHTIPRIYVEEDNNLKKEKDPVIIKELKKSELIKVYEQYFVSSAKPARKIYDDLLIAAKSSCPFCGGIGYPHTLDHFLPKTIFPSHSVLPLNLIPCCRDCNTGAKSTGFALRPEEQLIQPYADDPEFFTKQWIFAKYHIYDKNIGNFEYYVLPPDDWSITLKKRALNHFNVFGLKFRYATQAAESLQTVLSQIEMMKCAGINIQEICNMLLKPGTKQAFANHWRVGMYQALISSISQI